MIETSEYAKQTVDPKAFWIMVGAFAVAVCLAGAYQVVTGKMPFADLGLGRTAALTLLNLYWATAVYALTRRGWRALPWNHWAVQIG